MTNPPGYVSQRTASKLLGTNARKLHALVASGDLPEPITSKTNLRVRWYAVADLERFAQANHIELHSVDSVKEQSK